MNQHRLNYRKINPWRHSIFLSYHFCTQLCYLVPVLTTTYRYFHFTKQCEIYTAYELLATSSLNTSTTSSTFFSKFIHESWQTHKTRTKQNHDSNSPILVIILFGHSRRCFSPLKAYTIISAMYTPKQIPDFRTLNCMQQQKLKRHIQEITTVRRRKKEV